MKNGFDGKLQFADRCLGYHPFKKCSKLVSYSSNFEAELTGHNHYPWCTCGWCVGGGSPGRNAPPLQQKPSPPVFTDKEKLQAANALSVIGATSYSRCYVNPNASCPVCGQTVYFYANNFGSRVYFDELGPPWTKHPCTDNRRPAPSETSVRPVCRSVSEIKVILDAEKKLDDRILPVGKKARKKKWKLAVVTEVEFRDCLMEVLIEDISGQSHHQNRFSVYCHKQLLHDGDFVSRRGMSFSFLDPISFESLEVSDGDMLLNLEELEGSIEQDEIPQDIAAMLPSEKRHFTSKAGRNLHVHDEVRSVLRDFAKKGVVGPKLVSHYLNETGRTTAYGGRWTPRLAFFLILLSGVPQERPPKRKNSNSSNGLGKPRFRTTKGRAKSKRKKSGQKFSGNVVKGRSSTPAILTSDVDEWARMLSRLGRVSREPNDK